MAGLATSGTLTRWFRDQLTEGASFEELVREAEASPKGAKGLLCLPYFSGERTPIHDPRAKGAFFGLDLTHTRGDLFRAVLEGIAAGTRTRARDLPRGRCRPRARSSRSAAAPGTRSGCRPPRTLARVPQLVREQAPSAPATGTRSWRPSPSAPPSRDRHRRLEPDRAHRDARRRCRPTSASTHCGRRSTPRPGTSPTHWEAVHDDARGCCRTLRVRWPMDETARWTDRLAAIADARRVMLYGCGREGLMMRALAMRLHHLGRSVCMQGDMDRVPAGSGRPVPVCRGPGRAADRVGAVRGSDVRPAPACSWSPPSPTAPPLRLADDLLVIPAQTMARDVGGALGPAHGLALRGRHVRGLRGPGAAPARRHSVRPQRRCARVTPTWSRRR